MVPQQELLAITSALLHSARSLLDGPSARVALDQFCADLSRRVPNIVLAWTWFGDPDTPEIRPQVAAGEALAYARDLVIRRNVLTSLGPAFRALRGEHVPPFGISAHSMFGPWRTAARDYDIRSVMALPLESSVDEQRGILVIYARLDDYFSLIGTEVFRSMAGLFSAVLSRAAQIESLQRAATRDGLTGLLNRHSEPLLAAELEPLAQAGQPVSVLICDIDHFKAVNDTYGHEIGDQVLKTFASVVSGRARSGDMALRWGGEEFVIGLAHASPQEAMVLADDIRTRFAQTDLVAGAEEVFRATCSIGVATFAPSETLASALRRADQALYRAKREGRDRAALADSDPESPPEDSAPRS
jgi:diguanylate cyclase (GGDEF)-like protein